MFITLIAGIPALSLGGHTAWSFSFLVLLVLGIWGALALPGRLDNQVQARSAQLGVGAFLILSAIAGAGIAAAQATGMIRWFADDDLASPATLVLIAFLVLVGAQLLLRSTQKLAASSVNLGCPASIPTNFLGIFDMVTLGYLWLGRRADASWSADRSGAITFAALTAMAAAALLVIWCVYVLRRRDLWPHVSRATFIALFAASQEVILIVIHGAGMIAQQAAGLDLLIAGAVIGLATFLVGMLAEDTATAVRGVQETAHTKPARTITLRVLEPHVPASNRPQALPAPEEKAA